MRREGYRPTTIRAAVKTLKAVGRQCNILKPEHLKGYLARTNYSENRRDKILGDLTRFYKWLGVDFYRPLSRRVETLPFIPLESEIDSLIGGLGSKLSAFTRLVKETGARPRLRRISFKTLRHWKASTLYAKTKDLLLVKDTLGHRSISSTMKYTHLMPFRDDEYVCKVARTVEEAKNLVEDGFDYVTNMDEMKLFRKRK